MQVASGLVFFFQAEDGIRDLVRSRGLGDVYKRQAGEVILVGRPRPGLGVGDHVAPHQVEQILIQRLPVSYTHLTLPTSDLV